jgi:hypothetical protein
VTRLDRMIRAITTWWRQTHPDRTLERALPDYRSAADMERRAKRSGSTRNLHQAREAKFNALHRDLAGGRNWKGR